MFSHYNTVLFIPTEKELFKIFNIDNTKKYENFTYSFIKDTPIIITGIGKTNSAITSTLFFSKYKPNRPILTGICGAYRNVGLNLCDVVSISKDFFVDEGSFNGKNITLLEEKSLPVCSNSYVSFNTFSNFKNVTSNTVSLIPETDAISNIYHLKTMAHTENMEGASFGLSAKFFGVTAYQIRSISNFCGSNQEWNIKKSCQNLKEAILNIIDD